MNVLAHLEPTYIFKKKIAKESIFIQYGLVSLEKQQVWSELPNPSTTRRMRHIHKF